EWRKGAGDTPTPEPTPTPSVAPSPAAEAVVVNKPASGAAEVPVVREVLLPKETLTIHGDVNNADKLLGHLRDELKEKYAPDSKDLPESLKKLYSLGKTQDELT